MKPKYSLRCLGRPALFAPSGDPIRIRVKKHLALLVYLAVETRRSHRRDDLAEFLWPQAKIAEARQSLSTALSMFRSRLGSDALEAGREKIAIKPGRLALDLDRLLAGDILGDEFTPPLEVAAFLDGFDLADVPEFMLWKDRQQARLLPAIKQALVTLVDRCRRMGEFRQIEELADRMLALDDLSEEAIRAKMEARVLSGDRITALRVFEEWKAKLANDLQAAPSEILQKMATRLRAPSWQRTMAPNVPTVATEQWQDRPFVGRHAEYQTLYEAWERSRNGTPGHMLILGDSGIGKTTLVQRLITAVTLEGAAVSRVQCYDIEQEIPYSAVSALTTGLLDQPGSSATRPEALAELSRTVPEVQRRFPSLPSSASSYGETARIRLTEAFLELLITVVEDCPVLLIIDDLHFADDASLAVLHLILRRTQHRAIMMLFITRPGDLPQCPQALRLRESAASLRIKEVEIKPLNEDESQILLRQLASDDQPQPDPPTRRAILQAAAGCPMVLELLVQDWQASGNRCLAVSVDAITEELANDGAVATTYRRILQRITSTLQPAAQNVLKLAAILGPHLNDLDMYNLVGLGLGETINGVAELVNRRLLRDSGQNLEFVNELIRSAAYLAVPSPIRKRLHSQIADHFLQKGKTSTIELGLEIAWHCTRAGRQEQASAPLMRGARDAVRRGAPYIAEQALTTALPALKEPQRSEAILILAEALQEQSRWQDSLSVLQQLTLSENSSATELVYILNFTAKRRLGYYDGTAQLTEFVEQLIHFIYSSRDVSSRLRAAIEASSALNMVRSKPLAARVLDAISELSSTVLGYEDRPQLLLARAMALFNLENYDASIQDIRIGLAILNEFQGVNSTLAMLQSGLGSIQSLLGNYVDSVNQLVTAATTAARIGNERIHNLAAANLSVACNRLGEYRKSVEWAEVAMSYTYELHSAALQGALVSQAMLGDSQAVDALIERWTPLLRQYYPPGVWQAWGLFCADAYLMLNRIRGAEDSARRAVVTDFNHLLLDYYAGAYARWTARLGTLDSKSVKAYQDLQRLCTNLSRYHQMDQVEILVAAAWLEHSKTGNVREEDRCEIIKRLSRLPHGITDQLNRMRMLDWM